LRKSFLLAGAAALAIGGAATASAQAPTSTVTVKVSPTKAGTKKKPKTVKLVLTVKNQLTTQTASKLKITAPSQVTLSTKGFKSCSATKLANNGPSACPKGSQVGPKGVAHAMAGVNTPAPASLAFDVTPFVTGKNKIAFYLKSQGSLNITALANGKISGHTLNVEIPSIAQQFPTGVYNGLVDLTANLTVKRGKGVVKLTGCPSNKKLKFTNTIFFVPNPNQPAQSTSKATGFASCKK
jgi:hypothetical protein